MGAQPGGQNNAPKGQQAQGYSDENVDEILGNVFVSVMIVCVSAGTTLAEDAELWVGGLARLPYASYEPDRPDISGPAQHRSAGADAVHHRG